MESKKTKILVYVLIFLIPHIFVYAENSIDRMCGVWADMSGKNEIDYVASITKLNQNEYFVIYTSEFEKHVLDFSAVGYKKDNKIYVKINEEREFYIVLKEGVDTKHDMLYVLWNHDFPDAVFGDLPLNRVEYLYDYDLQQKEKEQAKKDNEQAFRKWLEESLREQSLLKEKNVSGGVK